MGTTRRTAIIFTGGEREIGDGPSLPRADLLIAADSGLTLAEALGYDVELVVGDLDSVPADALARAEASGARIERHPAAKDHTDLELALMAAADAGMTDVTVVGGAGGRLDHLLANLLLLGAPAWAGMRIDAVVGAARVTVVSPGSGPRGLTGVAGDLVSLLAAGGPASAVTTDGLHYPLRGEGLDPGSTRGVSNVLTASEATVSVGGGTVLVVQP